MFTEIELTTVDEEKKSVAMTANAATVIRYKLVFGRDLQKDITPVILSLNGKDTANDEEKLGTLGDIDTEVMSKIAYIMHKQAVKEVNKANVENYVAWLEEFSPMAFIESAADIISLYFGQKVGTSNPKKDTAPQIES